MPASLSREEREQQIHTLCEKHGEWSIRVYSFINGGTRCAACSGNRPFSQEQREQQIKQLCEGTLYSFVGWDEEYKNNKSKFICRCEEHGDWSVSVDNFINKNNRCLACCGKKHLSQEQREQQIKELCEGTIYSFAGWDGEYKNNNSKFICKCDLHGEWSVRFSSFTHQRRRCAACSGVKKYSQEEREKQIKELCEGTIYSFVGWDGNYENQRTKILIACEIHGVNPVRTAEFLNSKARRCRFCSASKERPSRRVDEKFWLSKIASANKNYVFSGWESERKDCNAKVRMSCEKHGEWILSIQTAIRGCTCPSCHHEVMSNGRRKPSNELITDLNHKLCHYDCHFVRFVEGYFNSKSRIVLNCLKHGEWESSPNKVLSNRGCPKCKNDRLRNHFAFTEAEATLRVSKILQNAGFHFVKWETCYQNQKSKAVCDCQYTAHG